MSDKQQQKHKQKARQARVKAQINRDKARRNLLRQREKLARRRTRNRKQSEPRRDDSDGDDTDGETVKNPAAHSTMPPQKSNAENAVRNSHSTVPKTPKYSDVTARERLYGQRLHQKTAGGNSEASAPSDESASGSPTEDEVNDE
ncbi:gas vesicle protein GvpI [Halobacterium salinarum]|uniref:Gas vesicle protein I1 n=3 Tax=Halobacterium salinarum NRC-34001 TaxID=2886895 RepID=GVPI1_HALSA|nr:gas vesicle protein GvpI [Halobacterium salinarum]Q9HI24.1 RecName: Full=Gas vesicle protein I1; Short=GvpI1 [Halobacterium salinarum NRC-1]AAA98190.1 gas vesicle protein [Halobacterium salinarum]AAC82803.1 GvpI [Halobacterium salinarum NRC-1]AAG20720.1 GvpI protein, cluster A [Halobacterium salinarum NRC-1]MDL0132281.1 gas vesicle protein GvpI [Halobacterium salinarum]CAP15035.1 gas-vesicle operon protein GvpI [Halobacterium salinarum R1]